MKTEEVMMLSRRAKNETEAFINRHFENDTKGWPKLCLCVPACADQCKKQQTRKQNGY